MIRIDNTMNMKQVHQGRLPVGVDLLEGLKEYCTEKGITKGMVRGIGAVSQAHIGYYDQVKQTYFSKVFAEEMEILSLKGNVSLKDGEVFNHVHLTLSRTDYSVIGGHVMPDTTVFVCEFEIIEFDGEKQYIREFDKETGLGLWIK